MECIDERKLEQAVSQLMIDMGIPVHLRGYRHVLLPRRPHAHDRGCAGPLRQVKRKSCKTHRPRGGAFFHALSRKSAAIPRKNRFITESWGEEQLGGASADAQSYWQGRFAACAFVECV